MEREKRLEDKISRQSVVQTLKGTVYVIFRPLFFLLKSTSIWAHNEPAKTTFLVLRFAKIGIHDFAVTQF